jgi:hypothetical protein
MAFKGLFAKGGNKTAPPPATRPLSGDETTIAPSATGSLADEKMQPITTAIAPESRPVSYDGGYVAPDQNKSVQPAEKAAEQEEEVEDDTEYPSGMKLALISIALCLSVFCMVSGVPIHNASPQTPC